LATNPEALARENTDAALALTAWLVQDADGTDLSANRGIAVREFPLARGHGHADYLLCVDGKTAGVIEAKQQGTTLTGVEVQAEKYATGPPKELPAHVRPLPFLYQSTGIETCFTSRVDHEPRSRQVPAPDVIAAEIVEDLRTALEQFEAIQTDLATRR
jgi:type I restriction enzyme R subunit